MARFGVILAAAGKSSRFQDANYKKPFAPLAGRPVWMHAAEKFTDRDDVKQVVIVVAPEDREAFLEHGDGGARHRARHAAADVVVMAEGLDVGDDLAAVNDRHGAAQVGQVAD